VSDLSHSSNENKILTQIDLIKNCDIRSSTMHVRDKRLNSTNGRLVDRALPEHQLGCYIQSAYHNTSSYVLRKRGLSNTHYYSLFCSCLVRFLYKYNSC
jgi:hypothetical protein